MYVHIWQFLNQETGFINSCLPSAQNLSRILNQGPSNRASFDEAENKNKNLKQGFSDQNCC